MLKFVKQFLSITLDISYQWCCSYVYSFSKMIIFCFEKKNNGLRQS